MSIIIVSYNTREMTLECLRSVYAQTQQVSFEVLVVDNASEDGSAEAIRAGFPQVRLLAQEGNLGFGRANNLAAELARGSHLLLLNPDTVVLDHAIEKLFAFAGAHPEATIFGGRTVSPDGSLNPTSCWARPTLRSMIFGACGASALFRSSPLFNPEAMPGWARDTQRQVDIVTGCFLLISRDAWTQLGGFDPAFFMYGEEADLCLRAGRLGHRCLICPSATIVHYDGASEKKRAGRLVRLFTARALLLDRHWPACSSRLGRACLDLWALTRVLAFGLLFRASARWERSFETWRYVWQHRKEWHLGTAS